MSNGSTGSKHWVLTLIGGILLTLLGVWVFFTPVTAYAGLAILFSLAFFVIGIIEIVGSLSSMHERHWGWGLAIGLIDLLIGIILMNNLIISAVVLPFILGFGLMFCGAGIVARAAMLKEISSDWGWVMFGGILTIIFAFLIIFYPVFGALTVVVWTALSLIFGGISTIALSFKMKPKK